MGNQNSTGKRHGSALLGSERPRLPEGGGFSIFPR